METELLKAKLEKLKQQKEYQKNILKRHNCHNYVKRVLADFDKRIKILVELINAKV